MFFDSRSFACLDPQFDTRFKRPGCLLVRAVAVLTMVSLSQWSPGESAAIAMVQATSSTSPRQSTESGTQTPATQEPSLRTFDPRPELITEQSNLRQAKFPVVDVHSHFGLRVRGDADAIDQYRAVMQRQGLAIAISLDAKLGSEDDHLQILQQANGRAIPREKPAVEGQPQPTVASGDASRSLQPHLAAFVHLDFVGNGSRATPASWAVNQPGFARKCVEQLRVAKAKGIHGVKFFKTFGLSLKDADGSLIKIDDPRFDPIWEVCGELGLPIIMHTADPIAFFKPIDANNERWEELSRHPNWSFYGDQFPAREELLAARNRVIARHPSTIFIGAHVANSSEDLATVARWLDAYPNLVVGIASRISELGRQPYTSRKFFLKYQDRILFGTDGPWPELRLTYYWRFLESWDEYFPYSEKSPQPQGLWRIYGIGLPDEVLRKVYHDNALRIMPSLQPIFDRALKTQK